jgi:hypothetical protein
VINPSLFQDEKNERVMGNREVARKGKSKIQDSKFKTKDQRPIDLKP